MPSSACVKAPYRGSYEGAILKRFQQFAGTVPQFYDDYERLFPTIALCCALRNGDARLKNFGVVRGTFSLRSHQILISGGVVLCL